MELHHWNIKMVESIMKLYHRNLKVVESIIEVVQHKSLKRGEASMEDPPHELP